MARKLQPFGSGKKRFAQMPTRLQLQIKNNLGIISTDDISKGNLVRSKQLDLYDQYWEGSQYDDLQPWDEAMEAQDYVAVRKRQPRVKYALPKVLVNKVGGKITGSSVFPQFIVEEDPDDTQFLRMVQKVTQFRRNLVEAIKHCLRSGSVFVRYYFVDGHCQMEHYNPKYCYPQFDALGELSQLEIKYVYEDEEDKDSQGKFKKKWYRLVLTTTSDTLYNNPDYQPGVTPDFQVVSSVTHDLGWVQGEWFRTAKYKFTPDGDSLYADILDFIDDMNYSLSQSSQAISFGQDPQLTVNGMDEDELDGLVKSSQKAWNLGRDGKAQFLETDLSGVKQAEESREANRNRMLEVVRVIIHDPEKIVGNAQSGIALRTLNAPLVELIDDLRTVFEQSLVNLLLKLAMTFLQLDSQGVETSLDIPAGFSPQSLDITVNWPDIFPATIQDVQAKAQICQVLSGAQIISRESLTRWIAPDLGIQNVEEELEKIEEQPLFNPFNGFGASELQTESMGQQQKTEPNNNPNKGGKDDGE